MNINFDFHSDSNEFLFSPFLAEKIESYNLINQLKDLNLKSHIFILSSGTTGTTHLKGYALSKEAILNNARAVNEHLGLTDSDCWLAALPYYHIGGLSIYARANLNGAKVKNFSGSWCARSFKSHLDEVTIASVVPAQCYDLVKENIRPPKSLRYLIVGGDYLNENLYNDLNHLNWPIIRTYGMTEVCSQLATEKKANCHSLSLKPLTIHEIKTNEKNQLFLKSSSLFTGVFTINESSFNFHANKDEFYPTNDLVKIKDGFVFPLGRVDNEVKIKGRRIDLNEFNIKFNQLMYENGLSLNTQYKLINDLRDGYKLEIHSTSALSDKVKNIIAEAIKPISVAQFKIVSDLHKTELGKNIL